MKSLFMTAGAMALMLLAGACSDTAGTDDVTHVSIAESTSTAPFSEVEFTDVRITPLDTAQAAVFSRGDLITVMDGCIVIASRDSEEIFVFDATTGHLRTAMSHKGQGPGEWSYIGSVFPDTLTHSLVITSLDKRFSRRTLTDSLVAEGKMPDAGRRRMPTGNPYDGYNVVEDTDSAMLIIQMTPDFRLSDTIALADYKLGYLSGLFGNTLGRPIVTIADTLFTIAPGSMTPLAVISRGGRHITPAIEQKISDMGRSNFEAAMDLQHEHIVYYNIDVYGSMLMVASSALDSQGAVNFDIFSLIDGAHLLHSRLDNSENPSGMQVDVNGATVTLFNIRPMPDGRFYSVLSEEQTEGIPGILPDQNAVVSFRITPIDK